MPRVRHASRCMRRRTPATLRNSHVGCASAAPLGAPASCALSIEAPSFRVGDGRRAGEGRERDAIAAQQDIADRGAQRMTADDAAVRRVRRRGRRRERCPSHRVPVHREPPAAAPAHSTPPTARSSERPRSLSAPFIARTATRARARRRRRGSARSAGPPAAASTTRRGSRRRSARSPPAAGPPGAAPWRARAAPRASRAACGPLLRADRVGARARRPHARRGGRRRHELGPHVDKEPAAVAARHAHLVGELRHVEPALAFERERRAQARRAEAPAEAQSRRAPRRSSSRAAAASRRRASRHATSATPFLRARAPSRARQYCAKTPRPAASVTRS